MHHYQFRLLLMSQLTGGSVAEVPKMSVRLHCYWNKLGKRFLQCLTEKNANTKKKKKADERTQVATSSSTQHAATLVRRLLFRTRLRLHENQGGVMSLRCGSAAPLWDTQRGGHPHLHTYTPGLSRGPGPAPLRTRRDRWTR